MCWLMCDNIYNGANQCSEFESDNEYSYIQNLKCAFDKNGNEKTQGK